MILFSSDINDYRRHASKTSLIYLISTLFCVLFGAVYERYSHEVYSFDMIYAFAFPLVGGTLPFSILSMIQVKRYPGTVSRNLYHSGIATLTVGSIVRGILEIYGTTNVLSGYYGIVGSILTISGLVLYIGRLSVLEQSR